MSVRNSQELLRQSQDMVASTLRRSQESVRQSQEMLRRSQEGILEGNDGGLSDGYHSNSEQGSTSHAVQHDKGSDWLNNDNYMHHHGNQVNYVPTSQQNVYSDAGQGYGQYYGQQYGAIPERQEAEGGNTDTGHAHTDHYATPLYAHQQHQFHPGFYRDTFHDEEQPRAGMNI